MDLSISDAKRLMKWLRFGKPKGCNLSEDFADLLRLSSCRGMQLAPSEALQQSCHIVSFAITECSQITHDKHAAKLLEISPAHRCHWL